MMTLRDDLEATAGVPVVTLRCAMVRALAAEPGRTLGAWHRFYGRVVEQLELMSPGDYSRGWEWGEEVRHAS